MKQKIICQEIPNSYKSTILKSGTSSNVYLTNQKLIYKEFKEKLKNWEEMERIARINSSSFVFPKYLIFLKKDDLELFAGYIRNYIEGMEFFRINDNISLKVFIEMLKHFEESIFELSRNNVCIEDVNSSNLIITPNYEIKAIDTDYYSFDKTLPFMKILETNVKEYNDTILSNMISDAQFDSEEVNKMIELSLKKGAITSSICISFIESYLSKNKSFIKTVGDFKSAVALTRKR